MQYTNAEFSSFSSLLWSTLHNDPLNDDSLNDNLPKKLNKKSKPGRFKILSSEEINALAAQRKDILFQLKKNPYQDPLKICELNLELTETQLKEIESCYQTARDSWKHAQNQVEIATQKIEEQEAKYLYQIQEKEEKIETISKKLLSCDKTRILDKKNYTLALQELEKKNHRLKRQLEEVEKDQEEQKRIKKKQFNEEDFRTKKLQRTIDGLNINCNFLKTEKTRLQKALAESLKKQETLQAQYNDSLKKQETLQAEHDDALSAHLTSENKITELEEQNKSLSLTQLENQDRIKDLENEVANLKKLIAKESDQEKSNDTENKGKLSYICH